MVEFLFTLKICFIEKKILLKNRLNIRVNMHLLLPLTFGTINVEIIDNL